MSLTAEPRVFPDHVRLICSGEFSQDALLAIYERAFDLAAAEGRPAVLVDIRHVAGPEPVLAERYEQAIRVSELQAARTPLIRFALLGHEPRIHPERFGEIVASRRGAVARVFADEAEALEWLLGQKT